MKHQTPARPNGAAFGTLAAWRSAELAWVQMNDIQAPPIGAQVEFSQPGSRERFQGEIVENTPEGRSRVCCEVFAHKQAKGQGMWVPWEDLQVVLQQPEFAVSPGGRSNSGHGDSQLPPSDRGF